MRAPRSETLSLRARSAAVAAPSPMAVNRLSSIAPRRAAVLWCAFSVSKINSGVGCWFCVVVAMNVIISQIPIDRNLTKRYSQRVPVVYRLEVGKLVQIQHGPATVSVEDRSHESTVPLLGM